MTSSFRPGQERDRFTVCIERARACRMEAEQRATEIAELDATIAATRAEVDQLRPPLELAALRLKEAQKAEREAYVAYDRARQSLAAASGKIGVLRYETRELEKEVAYWERQADALAEKAT